MTDLDSPGRERSESGRGRRDRRLSVDDRGVSINIGYTANLVVMTVIFIGLVTAGTGVIDSERTAVATTELDVAGNQLAAAIESTDRAARVAKTDAEDAEDANVSDGNYTVVQEVDLPRRTADESYTIAIEEDAIELTADDRDVRVVVPYDTELEIEDAGDLTLDGGSIEIVYDYDEDPEALEVRSA